MYLITLFTNKTLKPHTLMEFSKDRKNYHFSLNKYTKKKKFLLKNNSIQNTIIKKFHIT